MSDLSHEGLLVRQWRDYGMSHQSRCNLVIHLIAVPCFLAAMALLPVMLAQGRWFAAVFALAAMGGSIAAQGRGHRTEVHPPQPFTGLWNGIARLLAEQWITFPRFVLSGRWACAMRQDGSGGGRHGQ
ncbi:MAG: terminase [Castellaniella sp.]|uniref:terminase n=1 Tax=Castellaniella sp. TaxID=1955812 RepID=UPI003C796A4C